MERITISKTISKKVGEEAVEVTEIYATGDDAKQVAERIAQAEKELNK